MKLPPSPSPTTARRVMRGPTAATGETLGQGMDAALTLAVFFGVGYAVDRWLGTAPLFMVGLFLLVAVLLFISWKARYTARMEMLEAKRSRDAGRHRQAAGHESIIDP